MLLDELIKGKVPDVPVKVYLDEKSIITLCVGLLIVIIISILTYKAVKK